MLWTVELEKTLKSLLDCKTIKPVNPKGNQPWVFIGGTDTEAEASILWQPDAKSWFTGKDCDAGKDWGQEEKGVTEDEMVGWHHWLNGHEFEQTQGNSEGQRRQACCSSWDHTESDMTLQLKNNSLPELRYYFVFPLFFPSILSKFVSNWAAIHVCSLKIALIAYSFHIYPKWEMLFIIYLVCFQK